MRGFGGWKPYVPVAQRRAESMREVRSLERKGKKTSPVTIRGKQIANTFWGTAWCKNLEQYSDYANRLPRGRTYVRQGAVVDLQIAAGEIRALVSGSSLYTVQVTVRPVEKARWQAICKDCSGGIDSLVELLRGKFSKAVMERICAPGQGLFPAPKELRMTCSCPDWAGVCKHVAAVFYGVGARLDEQPELLFLLRGVDAADLIAQAASAMPLGEKKPAAGRVLSGDLSALFGIELVVPDEPGAKKKAAVRKKRA